MDINRRKEILKKHRLRLTDCRLDVLDQFIAAGHALSQKDLEEQLTNYDRVTLYRTLSTFMESGLLHRIPDDSGYASYGLCHDTCSPSGHHDNHLHFKCTDCGNIECLEDVKIPKITIPQNYQVQQTHLIMDGLCAACQ